MYRLPAFSFAIILSTAFAASAAADDNRGVYANIGATQLSTELDLTRTEIQGQVIDFGDQSSDITMVTGRLGYRLHDFFALEGELGFGLGGDEFNQTVPVNVDGDVFNVATNVGLDVKNYYVAFARGILPISEQFEVFIRGGYGVATVEADIMASVAGFTASGSGSDDASGFAYGIGGQFNITDKDGIRADYTRLEEANIISLSYARRF
jgi:opacity protein-like surface antigen